ncbi:MAG: methyl-accepting chemotaxis protein [Sulfuricurvum sp.]|nr:methyl-accepting chemotaxis protein [Sulfuricurvum sp.]
MFGISAKDAQLLENMLNTAFDIIEGKRNTNPYADKQFSDNKLHPVGQLITSRLEACINRNIKDMYAVAEAQRIMLRVKNGWYSEFIEAVPETGELNSFKKTLNDMIRMNRARFLQIDEILESYARHDYTPTAHLNPDDEKGGILERLIVGLNAMQNSINDMLGTSLSNGLELQNDANTLKMAVESLSTASNQQAASLEETAAAMEEMTSNVQNNAQKANDMARMAAQTDESAKHGAQLANRTASAMTEIQEATRSINNAVAIIENIAFQTNILSLNAAVEAATAGEAGKGFAVVAQEVRNLANRSADAAKEIKSLAEQAAAKSDEGMNIATELTKGFEVIAEKIEQTTMLVQDVSNASREQMQGISQINTAVTQLDQMTQENAKVASEADNIADSTIRKALTMVEDASNKNFAAKSKILSSVNTPKPTMPASRHFAPSNMPSKRSTPPSKPAVVLQDDVWESF